LTDTSATLTIGADNYRTIGTIDNQWPVRTDVSGWGYSPNWLSNGLYRPPMQHYSRFCTVSVYDETRPFFYYLVGPGQQQMQCFSRVEGAICLWWVHAAFLLPHWTKL